MVLVRVLPRCLPSVYFLCYTTTVLKSIHDIALLPGMHAHTRLGSPRSLPYHTYGLFCTTLPPPACHYLPVLTEALTFATLPAFGSPTTGRHCAEKERFHGSFTISTYLPACHSSFFVRTGNNPLVYSTTAPAHISCLALPVAFWFMDFAVVLKGSALRISSSPLLVGSLYGGATLFLPPCCAMQFTVLRSWFCYWKRIAACVLLTHIPLPACWFTAVLYGSVILPAVRALFPFLPAYLPSGPIPAQLLVLFLTFADHVALRTYYHGPCSVTYLLRLPVSPALYLFTLYCIHHVGSFHYVLTGPGFFEKKRQRQPSPTFLAFVPY